MQWKVLNYVQCKGYCAELENGIAGISMIYALCVPNLRDCATDKSFSIALLGHCFKKGKRTTLLFQFSHREKAYFLAKFLKKVKVSTIEGFLLMMGFIEWKKLVKADLSTIEG